MLCYRNGTDKNETDFIQLTSLLTFGGDLTFGMLQSFETFMYL